MPYTRRRRGERHIPPVPPPLRHARSETFVAIGYEHCLVADAQRRRAGHVARRKIAVIGGGVAGLTAAHVLQRGADVTLYEADDRLGGHADTHEVATGA